MIHPIAFFVFHKIMGFYTTVPANPAYDRTLLYATGLQSFNLFLSLVHSGR